MNSPINFLTSDVVIGTLFPDGSFKLIDDTGGEVQSFPDWKDAVEAFAKERPSGDGPKLGSKSQITMLQRAVSADTVAPVEPTPTTNTRPQDVAKAKIKGKDGQVVEVIGSTVMLDPDDIIVGPNPRGKTPNPEGMAEWMRQNADATGQALIQNIVVGPPDKKGKHVLYAGWTRVAAAQLNKGTKPRKPQYWMLRATIFDVTDDERRALGLMENLGRVDMSPIARAKAYEALINTDGWSQKDIAKRYGFSNATVSNTLSLLSLPAPTQTLVDEGKIDQTLAVKLSKMGDDDQAVAIAAIDERLASGQSADPMTDAVRDALRAAKQAEAEAAVDEEIEDGGEEGEEAEDSVVTAELTKMTRKEIEIFLSEHTLPGADPAILGICTIFKLLISGERQPAWAKNQMKLWTRKDGQMPDNGVISGGRGRKAKVATAE